MLKVSGGKASIFFLTKEISDSEKSVRSKMVAANIEGVEKAGKQVWQQVGYFGKVNPDYSCYKNDFPENCLVYINQAYLTVKERDTMIYCDYIILAQIIAFRSPPENVDEIIKNDKKLVKIYMPMYDITTGKFLGVKESVEYTMIRNEERETFFSYGYSSEHSSTLYCHSKQPIPNIFRGTAFNTHKLSTYLENKSQKSDVCFYLPSITDHRESINKYKDMNTCQNLLTTNNFLFLAIMDLVCNEIDFSFQEKEEEERAKRYTAETKIYLIMKDFINILNQNAISSEFVLKIIAWGYQTTKEQYMIIFYVVNKWERYFVDGLAKCIEENWKQELNVDIEYEYDHQKILKDHLYMVRYFVKSQRGIDGDVNIFYHN